MENANSFCRLMRRVKAGDDEAATALYNRFAHRLIGLARRRLEMPLRSKVDADDVLQSVFKSFFLRHSNEAFDLGGWDSLWGLLTTITVRKCMRKSRYFRQECRDVRRESNIEESACDGSRTAWDPEGDEPTPEQAATLTETIEQLLMGQEERARQIIILTLQGADTEEISSEVGCTQRTVQRVLARVRDRLQQLNAEEESSQ